MRLPRVSSARPRIFAALIIVAAAVISFESLKHLAEYAGFGRLSWLFPVTLDAVAAFGMDLWITRSPAWRKARALALAAILGSLAGNIADHWISQGTILPAVLGAVPPGALAWLLAVLHSHGAGTAAHRSGPDKAVRDAVWSSLAQADPWSDFSGGPEVDLYTQFRNVQDQFWSRVQMSGPDDCWPWTGQTTVDGYGLFQIRGRKYRAHRVAWSIATNDVVPDDLVVRHLKCDNPPCCNPAHLADGTPADNAADRVARRKREQSKTVAIISKPRVATQPGRSRSLVTSGLSDEVIVKAILDHAVQHGSFPSKRVVMEEHSVGSGRALRLLTLAKETEVPTDG